MNSQAGVALLRLASLAVAAVLVGLVLAVFSRGASTEDEVTGLATVQTAVFFFGPIAAIATLAFIVVLALTRPMSLAQRQRSVRVVALIYVALGTGLAALLRSTWWGLIGGTVAAIAAAVSWWFLSRPASPAS